MQRDDQNQRQADGMAALPADVQHYLLSLLSEREPPVTAEIDTDGRLVAVHGASQSLPAFRIGDDVQTVWPFLFGQPLDQPFVLPMVSLDDERVFHIHGVPAGARSYVLFLKANEQREMRQALQQKANEVRLLNHRQQRLVEQLQSAKQALEARERDLVTANEIKARFIAGMSHEFRTPLTAILGYAELIEDRLAGGDAPNGSPGANPNTDATEGQVASISRAARHLLSMVDNILDQARLEDGQVVLRVQSVVVRDLVDDIAAIVAPLAAARFLAFGAYVSDNVPTVLALDAMRLRQILLNLLGNAVKFTETGHVQLDLDWRDHHLICTVSDSGPGIAAEDQPAIFDAFTRGPSSEKVSGVGLGLNITRRLCELMGGRVALDSTPGQGSVFTASLPAQAAELTDPPPSRGAPPAPMARAGARVLLAEDDPDITDLVQIILANAGYQVSLAMNGRDALEQVQNDPPDLVLMDVNMPVMNGLDAARAMRACGVSCPVIALSASLGVADRDDALSAGYDAFLLKPIARADLLAAIARYLGALSP